jgi:CheY-like chemotaxis protein
VVDDEPTIREVLTRLLARRDYAVTEAASCLEAKAATERTAFDLVLCDVRLEDGSGVDCWRQLTDMQASLAGRFVFVTGDASAVPDGACPKVPVLSKPFTSSDLERVLVALEAGV